MKNQIIIHAAANQTRVALIENGELAQLFIESPENQRTVGNIYLAEVHKVMSGIRAAFIDLGTLKDAFLHFSDTGEHLENYLIMLNGKDALPGQSRNQNRDDPSKESGNGSITEEQNRTGALLAPKQKVLVQIVKEPIGSKGPRVSTNITVAGRFLVLIPMGEYVAVSKRIRSHKERRRLRSCISSVLPEGFGVIVRTLADGQSEKVLHEDLKDVLDKWNDILKKLKEAKPPSLLHQDMDMTESLVRDLFAKDYSRILIDDAKIFRSIKSYVSRVAPNMVPNIEIYRGSEHIFDYMKISREVDSVFSPRVKMPSGGYLIFEQTEAMYVVDVNSGRYAAKREQEDNSLKTNLESAREIAKQLRLRDIGGIIVVDFIDLREDGNRKKVYDELKREFRKDRAKTNVLPMSDFGLVQITRQRIRPSVVKSVSKVCPMCGGTGSIISQNTVVADIEGWLTKFKYNYKGPFSLDLHLNAYLRSMIQRGWISQRLKWFFSYRLNINIMADDTLSMNDFKFMLPNSEIDITETVLNDQSLEKAISETDLRSDRSGDKKADDPGLDYFKNETHRKSGKQSTAGRGSSRQTPHRGKSAGSPQNQEARSDKQTANKSTEEKKTEVSDKPTSGKQESADPRKSNGRQDDNATSTQKSKKNNSKAKYYKSSSKDTEGEIPAVDEKADKSGQKGSSPDFKADKSGQKGSDPDFKADKSGQKGSDPDFKADKSDQKGSDPDFKADKSSDDLENKENPGDTGDKSTPETSERGQIPPNGSDGIDTEKKESDIPNNEQLPSAIEVARQHRIEKEKKNSDNP